MGELDLRSGVGTKRTQWNRRKYDHQSNTHARPRVCIVPPIVLGQPNNKSSCNDAEIVGCIAEHMQENPHHAQVSVVMPVVVRVGVYMVVAMAGDRLVILCESDVFVAVMLSYVSGWTEQQSGLKYLND